MIGQRENELNRQQNHERIFGLTNSFG